MPLIFSATDLNRKHYLFFSFRKFSGHLSDRACHGFYSEYHGNFPSTGIEMSQDFTLGYSVVHRRSEHWPFPNIPKMPHGLSFWSVQRYSVVHRRFQLKTLLRIFLWSRHDAVTNFIPEQPYSDALRIIFYTKALFPGRFFFLVRPKPSTSYIICILFRLHFHKTSVLR